MKKIFSVFLFLSFALSYGFGQNMNVFNSVPLINGKVIFQQFIPIDEKLNKDQQYAILYKWCKDNYASDPMLSGIRFNDKSQSVNVSSKAELPLPKNKDGFRDKIILNYRFDAAITDMGCMLTIRDITYQSVQVPKGSSFPQAYTAEEMITDAGIHTGKAVEKELKNGTKKSTLVFFNTLYDNLQEAFKLK